MKLLKVSLCEPMVCIAIYRIELHVLQAKKIRSNILFNFSIKNFNKSIFSPNDNVPLIVKF